MWRHRSLAAIVASSILYASQAWGQQAVHRVAVLASTETPENVEAWMDGLRERGYVIGQDLRIEYRYFRGRYDQLPALLAELVAFGPEVIVTSTSNSAVAIHAAAPTIPLVFLTVADPVALGLVQSLAHPGGNVTGLATVVPEGIIGKHLQFLKDLVPRAYRIAVLFNPAEKMHQIALQRLPRTIAGFGVCDRRGQRAGSICGSLRKGARTGCRCDPRLERSARVSSFGRDRWAAARYNLPAMYFDRRYVLDGGLISYAVSQADSWRRAAVYVDKILKGENPGDLPVQQPTGYDLIVNLKTAKALGITVPPSILALAGEVIE